MINSEQHVTFENNKYKHMKNNGKSQLLKGMKFMGIAILLMFLGPVLISIGFKALKDDICIWLIIGIIISVTAIVLAFLGIRNIVNGLFTDNE